jgi:beta-galactosidase
VLTVYNRLDFTDLAEYGFRYWIEIDGSTATVQETVLQAAPHTSVSLNIDYEPVLCRYGATLNTSLLKDGREVAHTQHILPVLNAEPERRKALALTEDERNLYAEGEGFRYTFSKHYGTFTGMTVDGVEQLAGMMKLSAYRAPTDNDRHIQFRWLQRDKWQGENLDRSSVKIYDCRTENNAILVSGALSGISRAPLLRFNQRIEISEDGTVSCHLQGKLRQDAIWLPRLGYEWELPEAHDQFAYYGNGPVESYRDMCHAGFVGLHSSTAEESYVPYVRPQEHGNHVNVRMLSIGDMRIEGDDFCCNVSAYSTSAIDAAEHTDELISDEKTHVRVDYKVSGIGSNSCGPELRKEYRLCEKHIQFAFSISPNQ